MTSKKDQKRFDALQDIGCVCCHILGVYSPPDIHHILSGGRRMGNQYTIPLCAFHHRGVKPYIRVVSVLMDFGPSLADGSKPFEQWWGSQKSLLEKVNAMLSGRNSL